MAVIAWLRRISTAEPAASARTAFSTPGIETTRVAPHVLHQLGRVGAFGTASLLLGVTVRLEQAT
ncbi:MAG TPA: hypothetical protein VGW77_22835 [Candidatus Binatia bacterium]|nr:hypothetical protein [Candidatus Binatia bacterium]